MSGTIFKVVRVALAIGGLLFFVFAIGTLDWSSMPKSPLLLAPVIPLLWLSLWLNSSGFVRLIGVEDAAQKQVTHDVFVESWLVRYVPGPSSIASKSIALHRIKLPKSQIAKKVVLDSLLLLVQTLFIGAGLVVLSGTTHEIEQGHWLFLILWGALFVTVFVSVWLLVTKLVSAETYSYYLASRFALAFGFASSFLLVSPITPMEAMFLAGIYLFSAAVGYLALVIPGGIGLRESVFILSLVSLTSYGFEMATFLAVLGRAATLIADLAVLLFLGARKSVRKRKLDAG